MALKKSNFSKDPTSTIIGILASLFSILVITGVISQTESINLLTNIEVAIPAVTSIITGVILIFSRIFHKE